LDLAQRIEISFRGKSIRKLLDQNSALLHEITGKDVYAELDYRGRKICLTGQVASL
jgi:hypothetical protein